MVPRRGRDPRFVTSSWSGVRRILVSITANRAIASAHTTQPVGAGASVLWTAHYTKRKGTLHVAEPSQVGTPSPAFRGLARSAR